MIRTVLSARPLMQAVAMAGRAFAACFPPISSASYGFAPILTASPPPKSDGAAQLIQREFLAFNAMKARNLNQCKAASAFEHQCCDVTTAILSRGPA